MFHNSYIEISKSAFQNNLQFIKNVLGNRAALSLVIKGNAYGHGIENFLPMAEEYGVNHFSVFSADEALKALKSKKKHSHVMIMGMIDDDQIDWAIEQDISFYVFEFERLQLAIQAARRQKKKALIHIELETGMNRLGFDNSEFGKLISTLTSNAKHLSIEGICTHYAGAESVSNYLRVQNQIKSFNSHLENFKKQGIQVKTRHTASSASAMTYPETIMDMARIGIALYGYWPSQETYMQHILNGGKVNVNPLERVISWKTKVMSTKKVKKGDFVNYGTSYQTNRDMRVASVPVGYCHGFSRSMSNLGRVLIRGKRLSVVGVVNMNMFLVDITNYPNIKKGDEVVIIGKQGKNMISVSAFGEISNYVNYETLVRLPEDIPRKIVE
ncbi:MAG: alanine racemase [Balneolales bacterium]